VRVKRRKRRTPNVQHRTLNYLNLTLGVER
jgi:hypothetical protein